MAPMRRTFTPVVGSTKSRIWEFRADAEGWRMRRGAALPILLLLVEKGWQKERRKDAWMAKPRA